MPPRPPSTLLTRQPRRAFLFHDSPSPATSTIRTIKSLRPPRPARFNKGPNLPQLTSTAAAAFERKAASLPLRTGLVAIKKGMSAMYDAATGERTPCTVLQLDRVQVVGHKTRRQHGYFAVQVGAGWKHPSNVTRPLLGHYASQGVSPKRWVVEFRVRDQDGLVKVGESLGPDWFVEGQFVDARARAKGHGFTGVSLAVFSLSLSSCFLSFFFFFGAIEVRNGERAPAGSGSLELSTVFTSKRGLTPETRVRRA